MQEVRFSYQPDINILNKLNLRIEPGTKVAIIGGPGSGKSTLLQLIPKFYNPQSGIINIDENELAITDPVALRHDVGIVFQDPFLFSTSIFDNIRYGKVHANLSQVGQVAKTTQLHQFVMSLPKQYETWIGERGITLSGGQRQRMAIARCLLSDPKIILLDDATSNIDVLTENKLLTALFESSKSKTVVMATHRFSSIRFADLIIILTKGEISDVGNHATLLANSPRYQYLYQSDVLNNDPGALTSIDPNNESLR